MLRPAQLRRKTRALCQNPRNEMDHPARDLDPYDPPGTELVSAVFSAVSRKGEWLPSADDGDFIASLMMPVTEVGEFASWISPPKVGIDNKPGDFEYVKIDT